MRVRKTDEKRFKSYPPKLMCYFEHKYTGYYSEGKHCKKIIYLQKSDLKTLWFSLQRNIRTELSTFLKNYIPALLYHYSLNCLCQRLDPSSHLTLQINFHHFFIHGPGSWEKSLGTNCRRGRFSTCK